MNLTFSVVINTYNRMTCLPDALASLYQQRYPYFEVIVVNGPSTDGTDKWLKKYATDCKLGNCSETNLSKSRNIGIKLADADVVCFMDDDAIPEPNWLEELAKAYQDEKIVAAGGFVRDNDGVNFQARYMYYDRDANPFLDVEENAGEWEPGAHSFRGMMGTNTSFRRSALLEAGGFDEEFAYYLDETDVLVRLMDKGGQMSIRPLAEVHHKYAPSHIRTEKRTPSVGSYKIILRSIAYYCIQVNRNLRPLAKTFTIIGEKQKEFQGYARTLFADKNIEEALHDTLLQEVEDGIEEGIRDAFAHPQRQLISAFSPPNDFKTYPPKLPVNKRLRLCLISPDYPPDECGGIAVFMHHLAEELADTGHEITILTRSLTQKHTVDWINGVWVHRIPTQANSDIVYKDLENIPPDLAAYANNIRAEVLRINTIRRFDLAIGSIWNLDTAALVASKTLPVAIYLVTSYKLLLDSKPGWKQDQSYYKHHVKPAIESEKWLLQQADYILASTQAIADDITALYKVDYKQRLEILPFGVPEAKEVEKDKKTTETLKILYVGRLEERKGTDLLLETLPSLLRTYPELEVDIVGSDINDQYKSAFIKKYVDLKGLSRVHFLGLVDDDTLHQAYASCDIFVAPSRYESFGLIYLEAMRYAKPCIGFKVGGVPEVVEDGVTGILCDKVDVDLLQQALVTLIANSEQRQQMGQAGYQRYHKNYTIKAFARRIVDWVSLLSLAK